MKYIDLIPGEYYQAYWEKPEVLWIFRFLGGDRLIDGICKIAPSAKVPYFSKNTTLDLTDKGCIITIAKEEDKLWVADCIRNNITHRVNPNIYKNLSYEIY